jgi:hypothetical protein
VLYVDGAAANASDNNTGTIGLPLKTIGAAITKAADNTTVVVRAGDYHEAISTSTNTRRVMIQPYLKEIVHFDGSTAHPASAFTKTGTYWTVPVVKCGSPTSAMR